VQVVPPFNSSSTALRIRFSTAARRSAAADGLRVVDAIGSAPGDLGEQPGEFTGDGQERRVPLATRWTAFALAANVSWIRGGSAWSCSAQAVVAAIDSE
jgi:hypothetical protein